jgi:SAM-dependent methyltransferase
VRHRAEVDPIASGGYPCVGLDFSPDMLAEAQRKASERGVVVEWMQGDMRAFDLGRTFDFVFIAANALLHLHETEGLVSCFQSVREHLAPGARFVFDVFNPSMRMLAEADGVRRTRESLSFVDPDRGTVSVDVAEVYDAATQVSRGMWHFSTASDPDFLVTPLEIRSVFPQELPLLVSLGGLRLVERFGDWSGRPFAGIRRINSASASLRDRRRLGVPLDPAVPERIRGAHRDPRSTQAWWHRVLVAAEVQQHLRRDGTGDLGLRGKRRGRQRQEDLALGQGPDGGAHPLDRAPTPVHPRCELVDAGLRDLHGDVVRDRARANRPAGGRGSAAHSVGVGLRRRTGLELHKHIASPGKRMNYPRCSMCGSLL